MTSQNFCFPFPVDETDAAPVMPRLHLRPNPLYHRALTSRFLPTTHRAQVLRDVAEVAATVGEENGECVREGEDSFSTHRTQKSILCSPNVRRPGFRDVYDLSMCAWTCGCSQYQAEKEELGRKASCPSWAAAGRNPRGSRGNGCY